MSDNTGPKRTLRVRKDSNNDVKEESKNKAYKPTTTNINHSTNLETIYECPRVKGNAVVSYMGITKLKRVYRFSSFYNPPKYKVKSRKEKAKKLKRLGINVPTGNKISMDQLMCSLPQISDDENEDGNTNLQKNESLFSHETSMISGYIPGDYDENKSNLKPTGENESSQLDILKSIENDTDLFESAISTKRKKPSRRSGRISIDRSAVLDIRICDEEKYSENEESSLVAQPQLDELNINSTDSFLQNNKTSCDISHFSGTDFVASNVSYEEDFPTKVQKTGNHIKGREKVPSNRTRRLRGRKRLSGIVKPLYADAIIDSEAEEVSAPNSNLSAANELTPSKPVQLSNMSACPSNLLSTLTINSPVEEITRRESNVQTKNRRRSARLSFGAETLGSMWLENDSNPIKQVNKFPDQTTVNLSFTSLATDLQSAKRDCSELYNPVDQSNCNDSSIFIEVNRLAAADVIEMKPNEHLSLTKEPPVKNVSDNLMETSNDYSCNEPMDCMIISGILNNRKVIKFGKVVHKNEA